ncbi:MAG TPA: hypothetical protein VGP82_15385 [Ktedonobacterales bacterium]|nr:hypothetical protein [Ktedonobacterales bacterium]
MQDPNLILDRLHETQRELERKAQLAQMLDEGKPEKPNAKDRLLVTVGDALVAVGQRMRTQAQSAVQ